MKKELTLEQFLELQGPYFNVRLLKFYYMSTTKQEQRDQKDTDVLVFSFEEGNYKTNFLLLKQRADQETQELLAIKGTKPKVLTLPTLT